jgi:hypothetical protein
VSGPRRHKSPAKHARFRARLWNSVVRYISAELKNIHSINRQLRRSYG